MSLVTGVLAVGDGHELYWEQRGNPNGKPVVVLHGGPGSGSSPVFVFMFDPERYRIVQFDQRNCGGVRPTRVIPPLIWRRTRPRTSSRISKSCAADLGLERWMVWGGSWGTVLRSLTPRRVRCASPS